MRIKLKLLFIICAALLELTALSLAKFFDFELKFNYGIAFGLLNNFDYIVVVSSGLSLAVILYLLFEFKDFKINAALSIAAGGAAANFIERLCLGFVIDYINILYRFNLNISFNIADLEIVSGIAAGLYFIFFDNKNA